MGNNNMFSKKRIWELLEVAAADDKSSRQLDMFLIGLICLNIAGVMLSSVAEIEQEFGFYLFLFEIFSVFIFTIEYIARLWCCTASAQFSQPAVGRIKYAITPSVLIDLLAILPFYLPFFGVDLRIVRAFRIFRLLRVLKLTRYSRAFSLFKRAIFGKREELVLTAFVLVILLIISASLMFYAEGDAQPENFSSIPATLWWSVVTLTTVGYGDVYPITVVGKTIAGLISILGIGMVALPAGIISAGFVDEIANARNKKNDTADSCPTCGRDYDKCA